MHFRITTFSVYDSLSRCNSIINQRTSVVQTPICCFNFLNNRTAFVWITTVTKELLPTPLLPDYSISFLRTLPYVDPNCVLLSISLPVEKGVTCNLAMYGNIFGCHNLRCWWDLVDINDTANPSTMHRAASHNKRLSILLLSWLINSALYLIYLSTKIYIFPSVCMSDTWTPHWRLYTSKFCNCFSDLPIIRPVIHVWHFPKAFEFKG